MTKLAQDVFADYLSDLAWDRATWSAFVGRWLRDGGPKKVLSGLNKIDQKYFQEAVSAEFIYYRWAFKDGADDTPFKEGVKCFRSWIKQANEDIAFLQGNRAWDAQQESSGGCFVKRSPHGTGTSLYATMGTTVPAFGFCTEKDGGYYVCDKNGNIVEWFANAYVMVAHGGWRPA